MSNRLKIEFAGHSGFKLAGLLEKPDSPHLATALMAHCFTCGKDITAASRIARALAKQGFVVLRFDFTGIGDSDGDFANTNFTSNVNDLVAAADFLRSEQLPPSILIGHSLGGTAVMKAASAIPEAQGVVTIGSPADAQHVAHQFSSDIDTINAQGEAQVDLAGRKYVIKKQFLDDISATSSENIGQMKKPLLVLHSPIDETVSIKEAERIYKAANHPKSFISLDNANHLLTRAQDADYVANIILSWSSRFLQADNVNWLQVANSEISVSERRS